jgi:hypothetical protein
MRKSKKKRLHEANLKTPLRVREVWQGHYLVEMYIDRGYGYSWHYSRGCFDGNEPKYAFFLDGGIDIEQQYTEKSVKEAVRKFIMAWQYVWAEEYAESIDSADPTIVATWSSVDAMQKEFDV